MRLSETGQPRGSRMQRPSPAAHEEGNQRTSRFWKAGLSLGALVVLVAAAIGAISLGRNLVTHAAAQLNQDCTLIVPQNPLTAVGLATPYQLVATAAEQGPCNESNPMQSAFVQGAVLDPATGQISIYNPLVIDQGTQPAVAPSMPTLPANAIVALWFGSNGNVLRLGGDTAGGNCVNGQGDSPFGQFAYCNAPQFFRMATGMIQAGKLAPTALGTAKDGQPCPTVRDFSIVDQDQSDNVTTTYLITANGRVAQNTAINRGGLAGAMAQANASDNRLESVAVDGALGCTPWMAPDLADNGALTPALPLNELQASMFQKAPVALVPNGDPMVLRNGNTNVGKRNLYRAGVDQSQAASGSTPTYCHNLLNIAPARIQLDMQFTMNRPSPDAGAATNLFTFLAQRFNTTWGPNGLNCAGLLNQQSPITLQQDGNGVTTGATINLNGQGNGNNGNGNGNNGNGNGNGNGTGNGQPTPTPTIPPATGGNGTGNGQPTPTPTIPPATGGNGTGNGQGNGTGNGQSNTPTCVVNGVTVQGCMGTTTINGQPCTIMFDAATKQVTITCPNQG